MTGDNADTPWTELLKRAREGCPEALGRLLEPYRSYLLGTANQGLADDLKAKEGASDIVQETFFEALDGFKRFKGESPDELEHWLRAILGFRLVDFARRYRQGGKRQIEREVRLESAAGADLNGEQLAGRERTPRSYAIAQEEALRLWRAMAALPERDALVLRLRDQEGLPFTEIGQRLGVSADAARKAWVRALQHLRQELSVLGKSGGVSPETHPGELGPEGSNDTPTSGDGLAPGD
ncbi:MAG: sigma-70 family RNA polymerase sigma factor [Planctomycetaceae bacterium]|nr:sigma-70 family RNA polymerase sigma factor [Planctomycetaceae bacterium]